MLPPPQITRVSHHRVACDGAHDGIPAALGHPRVWLEIDEKGWVECGYCDRRFVLKGGDHGPERNELFPGELDEAGASTSAESRGPTGL